MRTIRGRPPTTDAAKDEGISEARLVLRAKADRRAFAELYARYVVPVYGYAERCLGDAAAAEDATSATFLKAMQAIGSCDEYRFRSWLFAIAHNVIADARRARHPALSLDAAGAVPDRSATSSPELRVLERDAADRLRDMLLHLPADQRELIELRLAGLSDLEIARVVGRSHGAVRTSQYRAIRRLRTLCQPMAAEEQR